MSEQTDRRRSRRGAAAIIAALVVVIAAVVVIALLSGGASNPTAAPTGSVNPVVTASSPAAADTPTPLTTTPRTSPTTRAPSSAPAPQRTRTAPITESTPAVIKKELSVRVVKMEAVQGTADGPGEIAGPSVRFTIRIDNKTGKRVALSDTVVNAYYGADAIPAIQLLGPGGEPFPKSVQDGGSASGIFVFNIPSEQRGDVRVTVDTSVKNPVIAFEGKAPRA